MRMSGRTQEIGSHFFCSADFLIDLQKTAAEYQMDPRLSARDMLWLSTGRQAIQICLRDIQKTRSVKRVLLPEYTCASVIRPFSRADLAISYYAPDESLQIRTSEINKLIAQSRADLWLFHPYFGFNTVIKDEPLTDVPVIYDATQAFYSDFDFSFADYKVVSLRKWAHLPDGAVAIKTHGTFDKGGFADWLQEDRELISVLMQAFDQKHRYIRNGEGQKEYFLSRYQAGEELIDSRTDIYAMSEESLLLYHSIDEEGLKEQRRNNFAELLGFERWNEIGRHLFECLPENVTPMYFPLLITEFERVYFQKSMAQHDVFCPVIWPKPEALAGVKTSEITEDIYNRILAIPIDQRYDTSDMRRLLSAVEGILSKKID